MEISQFFPPTAILVLSAAFRIARFENQRWTRARRSGFRGTNELFGVFVDTTGSIAMIFELAFVIASGWQFGWLTIVGLFAVGMAATLTWGAITTAIFSGDSFFVWMLGTLAIWPLMVVLAFQLSWFGLV